MDDLLQNDLLQDDLLQQYSCLLPLDIGNMPVLFLAHILWSIRACDRLRLRLTSSHRLRDCILAEKAVLGSFH